MWRCSDKPKKKKKKSYTKTTGELSPLGRVTNIRRAKTNTVLTQRFMTITVLSQLTLQFAATVLGLELTLTLARGFQ